MRIKGIAGFLVGALTVAVLTPFHFGATATVADKVWKVRYHRGAEGLRSNRKVKLRVTEDSIVLTSKKRGQFSIPTNAVKNIVHDDKLERSRLVELDDSCIGYGCLGQAIVVAFVKLIKKRKHYIHVTWQVNENELELLFEADSETYPHILAELERVTGREAQDLMALRVERDAALLSAARESETLRLGRAAWVGGVRLKKGRYQVVLLEEPSKEPAVYFFSGRFAILRNLVASSPVESFAPAESEAPAVSYAGSGRARTLAEVRLGDQLVRLSERGRYLGTRPVLLQEGAATALVTDFGGWAVPVSYVEYEGEPALRFPVEHTHVNFCLGYLYLTVDRVIYDDVHPPKYSRDAFSVSRDEARYPKSGQIKLPGRKYNFVPGYGHGNEEIIVHRRKRRLKKIDKPFWRLFGAAWADFPAVAREFEIAAGSEAD